MLGLSALVYCWATFNVVMHAIHDLVRSDQDGVVAEEG
jgi:hypothetical protein